jgi:hypothetical protein
MVLCRTSRSGAMRRWCWCSRTTSPVYWEGWVLSGPRRLQQQQQVVGGKQVVIGH